MMKKNTKTKRSRFLVSGYKLEASLLFLFFTISLFRAQIFVSDSSFISIEGFQNFTEEPVISKKNQALIYVSKGTVVCNIIENCISRRISIPNEVDRSSKKNKPTLSVKKSKKSKNKSYCKQPQQIYFVGKLDIDSDNSFITNKYYNFFCAVSNSNISLSKLILGIAFYGCFFLFFISSLRIQITNSHSKILTSRNSVSLSPRPPPFLQFVNNY